ncbi:MAG: tryptophan 7-halogenase [Actinobacteria bacterium]|nr:tryptophan 7-halogenase [Actinomycetota bacterium]
MQGGRMYDADVIVIGGGPAGATLGALLGMGGYSAMVLERDIHPRHHVGESLTPSTTFVLQRLGFLPKMEEAGFVHKRGAAWTAPRGPLGRFVSIALAEFPAPDAFQDYTYNIERDTFDALLLRHAAERGAKVLQGARVQEVLFDGERAVGVRVEVVDGHTIDLRSRVVVDASGRAALLGNQLGMRRKDPNFDQYSLFAWFEGLEPPPPGYEGYLFLHFLDLEQAWAWQIPLRNGVCSVGVVTDKSHFLENGQGMDEFFWGLVGMNRTLAHWMRGARQTRPWSVDPDYSYLNERFIGDGWLLIGDAVRFVDPIFSSGCDIAMFCAAYAYDAIDHAFRTGQEQEAFERYAKTIVDGVSVWYALIQEFYRMKNIFTRFATNRRFRPDVVRTLQGNLYLPEAQERAKLLLDAMAQANRAVSADPANLLRPGALRPVG